MKTKLQRRLLDMLAIGILLAILVTAAGSTPAAWAAAPFWGNGKVYFFGCDGSYMDRYFRYDISTDKVEQGPLPVGGNWPGWPAHWGYDIDATLSLDNGMVIFFRQDQYILYNTQTRQVEQGYPKSIYSIPGWPASFYQVQAAINWGNGKGYIFNSPNYLRINLSNLTVDDGFPAFIQAGWPGWPATWDGIDAISDMGTYYLFLYNGRLDVYNKSNSMFLGEGPFTGWGPNWPADWTLLRGGMRIGGRIYFFQKYATPEVSYYLEYDVAKGSVVSGFPRLVSQDWAVGTWPSPWGCVEAAVNWGDGKAYFFSGARYLRYDIRQDHVDPGYPLPIQGNWKNWPANWDKVTGAANWGNGKVYFFSRDQYLRYDIRSDQVDPGYPLKIAPNWPGYPAGWTSPSVLNWGSGKAYFFFFFNDQYLRYDVAGDKFDAGYPLPVKGSWPTWPVDSQGKVLPYYAAVPWGDAIGLQRVFIPFVLK